jgi:hypothetical protein
MYLLKERRDFYEVESKRHADNCHAYLSLADLSRAAGMSEALSLLAALRAEARAINTGSADMKTETGVMIMKNGKAWGCVYEDGHSTSYGWMEPESAPIHDPKYVTKPTDVTYQNSPYIAELSTAQIVSVVRTITVAAMPNYKVSDDR